MEFKKEDLKVGFEFKMPRSRKVYEIISIFEDNGETFWLAKTKTSYGCIEYRKIFYFDKDGEFTSHI